MTFYGPALAASFGEFPPFVDQTFESFQAVLGQGLSLPYSYPTPVLWTDEFIDWKTQDRGKVGQANQWICVRPGYCRGALCFICATFTSKAA